MSLTCSVVNTRNNFKCCTTTSNAANCTEHFHTTTCDWFNKVFKSKSIHNIIAKVSKYSHTNPNIMKIILNTGATRHLTGNIKLFHTLNLQLDNNLINVVPLVDGNTTLPIHGVGNITINIGIHKITIKNVLYVLQLKDTMFAVTEHIKTKDCSFMGINNQYTLTFPKLSVPSMIINEVFIPINYVNTYFEKKQSISNKINMNKKYHELMESISYNISLISKHTKETLTNMNEVKNNDYLNQTTIYDTNNNIPQYIVIQNSTKSSYSSIHSPASY